MPPGQARKVIEAELGARLEDVFDFIDLEKPLGSASIAQARPCSASTARLQRPGSSVLALDGAPGSAGAPPQSRELNGTVLMATPPAHQLPVKATAASCRGEWGREGGLSGPGGVLVGVGGGGGGGVGMHVLPGKRAGPGRRTCAARVQQPRWQPPCACRAALRRTRGRPGSDPAERARCGGQVHKARLRQARGARAPRGGMAGGGRPLGWRAPPRGAPGRAAGAAGAGGRHGGGAGARDSDGAIAGSVEAAGGGHPGGVGNGARGGLPQAWRLRSGQEPAMGSAAGERARAPSSGARLGTSWGCGCVCRQAAGCCLARRALACLPMDRAALAANDAQGVHSSYTQGPDLTDIVY